MLDILRANAAARGLEPRLRRADTADFTPETFDPVNAVRHLTDPADQRAAFRNVRNCLADGDRFAFWADLPDYDVLCARRDGETTVDPLTTTAEPAVCIARR